MPTGDRPPRARPYTPPENRAGRLGEGDLPPALRGTDPAAVPRSGRREAPVPLPSPPRWAQPGSAGTSPPHPSGEGARPTPRQSSNRSVVPPSDTPRSSGARPDAPATARRPRTGTGMRRRPVLLVLATVIILALCGLIVPRLFKVGEVTSAIFVTPPPRPAGAAAFPDWSKQERVNILLLGLDTRVPGDSRSDTMILVSIDPAAKTTALISIPRDLWVPIPGFGENRINAAYQFGETNGVAGGGPGLAMQTVEQNFGVPVHYFAQVDFEGFRGIVDALGGVTIDVPRPLIDNEYPSDTGSAYQRLYIPMGLQHMDGRTALQYVRSRHADSDLGRNDRQQAMLLALREQGTQISVLGKIDGILGELKGAVRTDLSFTQVGSLAKLAQGISRDSVHQLAVGGDLVEDGNVNGAAVLLPHWDAIRTAVQALTGGAAPQAEAATVGVLNGTDTAGLARQTAERLRNAGFTVPDEAVGNPPDAGAGRYPLTRITDYSAGSKPATLRRLLDVLKLPADRVTRSTGGPPGVDIQVLVGEDLAR